MLMTEYMVDVNLDQALTYFLKQGVCGGWFWWLIVAVLVVGCVLVGCAVGSVVIV
jgi:uncharacterized membrane protein